MLVADFVLGGRAVDLYLTDWSELEFEWAEVAEVRRNASDHADHRTPRETP